MNRPKPSPAFVRSIAYNLSYWQQRIASLSDAEKGSLDNDKDNLMQAIRYGLGIEETRHAAVQIAVDAFSFVERAGYGREGIAMFTAIIERELVTDCELLAAVLNRLGQLHVIVHEYDLATPYLIRARKIAQECASKLQYGNACWHLGVVYWRQGSFDEAERLLLEARTTLSQTSTEAVSYAAVLNALASLYKDRGSFDDAERIYHEAITVAEDNDLVVDQARIWGNLAGLYIDTGRLAEGQAALEVAERLLTDLNYNSDLQIIRFRKLNILTQLGEWSLAESVARGIDFHSLQQAGSLSYAAASHLVFGQVLAEQKKFDEAEANLREGIAIAQRADAPMQQVFGVTELALFLTKSRRYAEAQHYFEEADQIARENPQSVYLQKMRDEIAEGLASVAEAMKSGADRSGSTP